MAQQQPGMDEFDLQALRESGAIRKASAHRSVQRAVKSVAQDQYDAKKDNTPKKG